MPSFRKQSKKGSYLFGSTGLSAGSGWSAKRSAKAFAKLSSRKGVKKK